MGAFVSIRTKLYSVFFLFTLLVTSVGLFGLNASKRITASFEGGEKRVRSIVSAAIDASSYVKRAEGHLLLYLNFHDDADRNKFFKRTDSLRDTISFLYREAKDPVALKIIDRINLGAEKFEAAGKELLDDHDRHVGQTGIFDFNEHDTSLDHFYENSSSVRKLAINLANYETKYLNRQEAISAAIEVSSHAKRAESHLVLYLMQHKAKDRKKFFDRYKSMREEISKLTDRAETEEGKRFLERITVDADAIMPIGKALIKEHDTAMKKAGAFHPGNYEKLYRELNDKASSIRRNGIELANLNAGIEMEAKESALIYAAELQRNIAVLIIASALIALILGYVFSRTIADPIVKFKEATRKIGGGDLDAMISVESKDEIGELADSFRQMTRELKETMVSRNFVESIIESMVNTLIVVDLVGTIFTVNDALCSMLGYDRGELLGRSVETIFRSDIRFEQIREDLFEKVNFNHKEIHYSTIENEEIPMLVSTSVIQRDNEPELIIIAGQSILELKNARKSLEEERERLAVTLESIGDGVISTDTSGNIILINSVAEKLTGWDQKDARGQTLDTVFQIVHEKTGESCESPFAKVMRTGNTVTLQNHTVLIAKDGTRRPIADSGAPIRDRNLTITGVVLVFRDITEERRIEEELRNAQKLESVGVLAGGIAHDFNNYLSAILTNTSMAKIFMYQGEFGYERLEEAEKVIHHAQNLTKQLLTFSIGGAPIKQTASIGELIKESAGFAIRGSNVKSEFSIPEDLWSVDVDGGQLSQAINNLVMNADQSMPDGGSIHISAENVTVDGDRSSGLEEGKYVHIAVRDEGPGIDKEIMPKIFDPYFTTKDGGSGLGLATTYSIIEKHDGDIRVGSEKGKGATFHIYLPASSGRPVASLQKEKHELIGKGKILVLDDEEMFLDAICDGLTLFGYKVKGVKEGSDAVDEYQKAIEEGDPFDAVVMDLTIPGGMGGKLTMKELQGIDPDVKAIISSGYSNDPIMSDYARYGFKSVLAKPYGIEELCALLLDVISQDNPPA
jgi:PAS domain S-box-containing protein